MATCNGETFLEEQLLSILNQTYQNFQITISDDCSSDGTVAIIKEYQQKYPQRITLLENNIRVGVVKNFESLLENCIADYIAFCDQDDIWEFDKLQKEMEVMLQLEATIDQKACLVHSDLLMIDDHNNLIRPSYFSFRGYRLKDKKDLGHILGPSGVMGNTLLINKALRDIVLPFPDTLDVHDYWIGVCAELFGYRKTLHEPLVRYRIHGNNTSNSFSSLNKKSTFLKFFSRDIKLPNLETKRKIFLHSLLEKIKNSKDKKTFQAYLDYLEFKKNRLEIYFDLIKYSLVKRGFLFRIKLFFKIIFTNRY